jgi:hypothetical protein
MRNLIIIAVTIFTIAIIAPELRPLLLVGSICIVAGYMLGARYGGKEYVKLMDARAERMATPVDSIREATL